MMAVLMLIPAAIGYISTRINYDILSYLPEDLESSHGEKLLEEPFKMAATSMLVVESMPAGYTNSLLNDIKAIDGVSNAIWISNLMGIQIPTDMIPANFRDMFFAGDARQRQMCIRDRFSTATPAPRTRPWRPSSRSGGPVMKSASWRASPWSSRTPGT